MILNNNILYCLIRHGDPININKLDTFSVISYDMYSGNIKETWFRDDGKEEIFAYGLGKDHGSVIPFNLSKSKDGVTTATLFTID